MNDNQRRQRKEARRAKRKPRIKQEKRRRIREVRAEQIRLRGGVQEMENLQAAIAKANGLPWR